MSYWDSIGITILSYAGGFAVFEFVKAYLMDLNWFKEKK